MVLVPAEQAPELASAAAVAEQQVECQNFTPEQAFYQAVEVELYYKPTIEALRDEVSKQTAAAGAATSTVEQLVAELRAADASQANLHQQAEVAIVSAQAQEVHEVQCVAREIVEFCG